jgi:hypothetical protein
MLLLISGFLAFGKLDFPFLASDYVSFASFDSFFGDFLRLHEKRFFVFRCNSHQFESIFDEIFFNHIVEWS